jgi:hypothetical protein
MNKPIFKQDWAYAEHEKVKEAQLRETASLPFSKKLEWLEQMQEMIQHMKSVKNTSKI